jgi:hypothetical protein
MYMQRTRTFLQSLGLPRGDLHDLPTSSKRFPDGAQYRVEIPSVEGPKALATVLTEAESRQVPVHRISQGSGVMLLTDSEIQEMANNFGDFIRQYEIGEIVRVTAPVYVKFDLRNAPDVYPSGTHLEATIIALSRERVRRAEIGLDHLRRYYPEAAMSELGAHGLAVPQMK